MKSKAVISILAILAILIFATPFMENKTASTSWILFFMLIGVMAMILTVTLISKNPNEIVEKFRNQHIILQILDVVFLMVFVYAIATENVVSVSWILLGLIAIIPICQCYLKKE